LKSMGVNRIQIPRKFDFVIDQASSLRPSLRGLDVECQEVVLIET
jgi:hypothetical protein